MSHILHLGHQPTDISGIAGHITTAAAAFDSTLDINGLTFSGNWQSPSALSFAISFPEPTGDLWLGFRYRTPSGDAHVIRNTEAGLIEVFDAQSVRVAAIRPLSTTNHYHAAADGDTLQQGTSSFMASSNAAVWVDIRIAVGAGITVDFYVDGVLHSSATAPNTGGKGKPALVRFLNRGLHDSASIRTWHYAHFALLDGVPTIGRRFVRRRPDAIGSFNQMQGSVAALTDGDFGSRVASSAAGQRMSFSLTGPTGPAAVSAIAGLHIKQIAQGGTEGPDATAGFLRMGSVNHDAAAVSVPSLAPGPVWSSWALNPGDGSPWSALTLPTEVGIVSA